MLDVKANNTADIHESKLNSLLLWLLEAYAPVAHQFPCEHLSRFR